MKTSKLLTLQTMRFFAALCVVQYHLWQNYLGITIGHPGTDFFLVLVGVVAAYTQARTISRLTWRAYISGRYIRLYITFIPLFLITLAAKWAEADLNWAWRSFLFIPIPNRLPVIGNTWMISMFLLFYFIFSLCFLMKTEKVLWVVFGVWAALIVMYNFFGLEPGLPQHWADLMFNERNLDFIMGYVIGIVLRNGWLQGQLSRMFLWVGMLGILGGTRALNSGYSTGRAFFVGIPVALFTLGLAALELEEPNSRLVKTLSTPWLVWLGGTSYVLYLSHSIFFQIWRRVLPVSIPWVLPMTVGAIMTAAFGYLFWERPFLAYIRTGTWVMPQPRFMNYRLGNKVRGPGE